MQCSFITIAQLVVVRSIAESLEAEILSIADILELVIGAVEGTGELVEFSVARDAVAHLQRTVVIVEVLALVVVAVDVIGLARYGIVGSQRDRYLIHLVEGIGMTGRPLSPRCRISVPAVTVSIALSVGSNASSANGPYTAGFSKSRKGRFGRTVCTQTVDCSIRFGCLRGGIVLDEHLVSGSIRIGTCSTRVLFQGFGMKIIAAGVRACTQSPEIILAHSLESCGTGMAVARMAEASGAVTTDETGAVLCTVVARVVNHVLYAGLQLSHAFTRLIDREGRLGHRGENAC